MEIPSLPSEKIAPSAADVLARFHPDVVKEVAGAVAKDPIVVVGMAQNPFVKKARRLLDDEGVRFTYLEYGSYFSKWRERLAIKLWSGWPTFPQVFVRGVLLGGEALTLPVIADGSLKRTLSSESP
jgi:glutaredoxin-related protein